LWQYSNQFSNSSISNTINSLMQGPTPKEGSGDEPPPPPCSTLLRSELNPSQSFFQLQDGTGRCLDVRASFAPDSLPALAWKIFATALAILTLIYGWAGKGKASYYLAYLTHWSLIAAIAYLLASLYQTVRSAKISQPVGEYTSGSISVTWILFAVAAHAEVMIAILFWLLVYDYDSDGKATFLDVMQHGGMVVLVWVDGLVVNRIPVRWTHWWGGALPFEIAWAVWSIFQSVVFDIGNPDQNDLDDNDDAIYEALDWKHEAGSAMGLALAALLILGPIIFSVLWLCSWYTRPCCCRGGNRRRYLDASTYPEHRPTSDPEEGSIPMSVLRVVA
jgi:hypothetical protein